MQTESAILAIRVSRIAVGKRSSLSRTGRLQIRFFFEMIEIQLNVFRRGRSIPIELNQTPLPGK
jgi:hypothetical protein